MANSFGGALKSGEPVVLTSVAPNPETAPMLILQEGKEKEALDILEKMGIIKIAYSPKESI